MSETYYVSADRDEWTAGSKRRLHAVEHCSTLDHANGLREATAGEVDRLAECKECGRVHRDDDTPGATGPHYRAALRHGSANTEGDADA